MATRYLALSPYNVRNLNKLAALDLIRFTSGGISRADMARQLNLSRSAITTIVNDLLVHKVIREANSGPKTGGRRPVMLEVNPAGGFVAGLDLGASHLRIVITDLSARLFREDALSFDIERGPQESLSQIDILLRQSLASAGLALDQVLAAGVGVPGPVVAEAGGVMAPPIMPGWDKFPIRRHLESLWGYPVILNNDAELGALGEWAYGAGRGERNLIYVKVGTGVGAGLILNGELYFGSSGTAGEIGHITLDGQGPLCACGNHGCLEAMSGGRAIARTAREAVRSGRRTSLSAIADPETITAMDVGEAARQGDLVAQQIVTEAGRHLGTAIASLVNLFNPGMVIVGGGLAEMGDLLLEPIRQTVEARSLRAAANSMRITSATLGRRSSSMGAVVQALTKALHTLIDE